MYEVEVKVRASHDAIRPRLDGLGAESLGRVRQVDTYYDAPHRDFAETDEALRLRRETPANGETTVLVTYKGPLIEAASKTREEAETAVADGDAVAEILAGLGFEPAATVTKNRERYGHDGYTVTLDDVAGLGEFVEVETAVDTEGGVQAAREGAADLLATLDLDPDEQIRTSYLGLLLAAGDADSDNPK
jgi:adenylate cyclase class 2